MESEKKRGRPQPVGKRPTYAFRMSETLHAQVASAALANGRSMAEEMERRLERSFANDEMRAILREELAAAVPEITGSPVNVDARGMDGAALSAALRQLHRETKIHG